ncbi:M60 family metallopeptidase, partial [Escherichia coli]|uniref:M60 family metallopeptidase n=1 Tax=Escherichia coli TaxID=562 RepID=UPI001330FD29
MIGSKKYADARIEIEIRDAVKGPYFNTTTHSLSEWNSIKNRQGPWVTIEGRRSVISVPKEQVAQLTDPAMLMGYYDSHIEDIEWLAGFDGNGA